MAECPKCHKEIDRLYAVVKEKNVYSYSSSGGVGVFTDSENIDFQIEYWKCPQCHEILDLEQDEESAIHFLSLAEEYADLQHEKRLLERFPDS